MLVGVVGDAAAAALNDGVAGAGVADEDLGEADEQPVRVPRRVQRRPPCSHPADAPRPHTRRRMSEHTSAAPSPAWRPNSFLR